MASGGTPATAAGRAQTVSGLQQGGHAGSVRHDMRDVRHEALTDSPQQITARIAQGVVGADRVGEHRGAAP